jgi:hypothetical protein
MRFSFLFCGALIAACAMAQSTAPAGTTSDSSAQAPAAPAAQAPAAAPATPPAPPPKYGGWVFSGLADGYFGLDLNHPTNSANQLQNFDTMWGQPENSLVKFTVDKSDKVFGIHVDVGFGETMRLIHAADVAAMDHKALRYLEQAYVIVKPNHTHGSEFDFGQFVTSAGAEVIESSSNWNYTRSLLFSWAIPYYHFGLRESTPINSALTVGFQVVNAWNTVWGNNNLDNVGLTLAYTKPKYVLNVNYYEGPNHIGTMTGKRNLLDATITVNPTSKFSFYLNGDYGRDNRIGGGYDDWYGLAAAARYQAFKKVAFAFRSEVFNDATGFSTGTKQILTEATATGEYKYNDHLVARLEARHDNSNEPFFDRGSQLAATKGMSTFTLGIVALLGPLK